MRTIFLSLCFLYSLSGAAQGPTLRPEFANYQLVELLNKTTKKYDTPIARNNSVTFDYENKKIVAIDTVNGLKNIYNIKNFKTEKTGKLFNCVEEQSQMECTVQTATVGTKKTMEVAFKNGFKLRFTKP